MRQFGEDIAEQLERIPATFKVIRHVRPKFACAGCERVVEAPAPVRPIERGLAGPALLAHVLVSKYADHQPLYRQSEMYAREGVHLDRSTMAGWVGAASELLTPLLTALQKHVLGGNKLHADDTPIPVLAPGNGKTKTGRLWTYVRGKPAELRQEVRQTRAMPLIDELHKWMEKMLRSLSTKSETAGAIRYALSHWRALTRYIDDGRLEIDNSAAERALRAVALGRKNYLFAGSNAGGDRAAALYTLIGSAKLNGLDPELYLRTALAQIADHPISRIGELLPWNLLPSPKANISPKAA